MCRWVANLVSCGWRHQNCNQANEQNRLTGAARRDDGGAIVCSYAPGLSQGESLISRCLLACWQKRADKKARRRLRRASLCVCVCVCVCVREILDVALWRRASFESMFQLHRSRESLIVERRAFECCRTINLAVDHLVCACLFSRETSATQRGEAFCSELCDSLHRAGSLSTGWARD